jgi:hypothetical protein
MECLICNRHSKDSKMCRRCETTLRADLSQLPELQKEAKGFLVPGRSGSGSPSTERSIGFNVNALDYSMANETISVLHKYEIPIRRGRSLTPPAYLKPQPTTELELEESVKFHLAHLEWTINQEWVKDFAGQVKELHTKGMAVTKKFIEQPRRIPCPTDDCKSHIVMDMDNLLADVVCHKCRTSWTMYRLLTLALNNPNKVFYLDMEAICLWLSMTPREILKIVNTHNISKKNGLYDFGAINKAKDLS